jgi:hypothetical protein
MEEKRVEALALKQACSAASERLTGARMEELTADELEALANDFAEQSKQVVKGYKADVRKRRAQEAKEAVAAVAKKVRTGAAETVVAGSPVEGGGLGGFSNRQCALPRISCEARGRGLGCRNGAVFGA